MQEIYEEMMERYEELKRWVRGKNPHLYERWKAGGFLVDEDILSMYPHLGKVMELLEEGEDCDE